MPRHRKKQLRRSKSRRNRNYQGLTLTRVVDSDDEEPVGLENNNEATTSIERLNSVVNLTESTSFPTPPLKSFQRHLLEAFYNAEKNGCGHKTYFCRRCAAKQKAATSGHQRALLHAAFNGDVAAGLKALAMGADPNMMVENMRVPTALNVAASEGHVKFMEFLLSHEAMVDLKDSASVAPIHVAASSKNLAAVELLVEHGADINAVTEDNETALMMAAKADASEIIEFLAEKGADVNAVTTRGITALHIAVSVSGVQAAQALIDRGANPNVMDENGCTALHIAVSEEVPQMTELLLKRGACANVGKQPLGYPLELAIRSLGTSEKESKEHIRLLLDYGVSFDTWTDRDLFICCHLAISYNCTELAIHLINANCPTRAPSSYFDVEDFAGASLLAIAGHEGEVKVGKHLLKHVHDKQERIIAMVAAAEAGNADFVDMILSNGIDANVFVSGTFTTLHLAIIGDDADDPINDSVVSVLNKHGADLNKKDLTPDGNSPLHYAAHLGKADAVQLLIRLGADVEVRNDLDITPLMTACETNELSVVRVLVEEGKAKLSSTQDDDPSPMGIATTHGHIALMEYLLSKGAPVDNVAMNGFTPLSLAVQESNVKATKVLLRHGADPNRLDKCGQNALHDSIANRSFHILQLCLDAGGDVHQKDGEDNTPIKLACSMDNLNALKLLIKYGADVNDVETSDETPLIVAVTNKCSNGLLKYLLENGVDINAVNSQRRTALHLAAESKATDIVNLLLSHGANPYLTDTASNTALDLAQTSGHSRTIRALKEAMHEDDDGSISSSFSGRQKQNTPSYQQSDNFVTNEMAKLFICPISSKVMKDPVVASDGHSYERMEIERWLEHNEISPVTKEQFSSAAVIPNITLQQLISAYRSAPNSEPRHCSN